MPNLHGRHWGLSFIYVVFLPPGAPRGLFSQVPPGAAACARRKSQDRAEFHFGGLSLSLYREAAWSRTMIAGFGLCHYFWQFFLCPSLPCPFCEVGVVVSVRTSQGCCEDYMNCSVNVGSFIQEVFTELWQVWLSGLSASLQTKGGRFDSQSGHMPGMQIP